MPTTNLDTVNDKLASELRAAAARQNMSGAGLARRCGAAPLWVQRRLSGTATITLDDLVLLCSGLGVHVLDVVAQVLVDLDLVPRIEDPVTAEGQSALEDTDQEGDTDR